MNAVANPGQAHKQADTGWVKELRQKPPGFRVNAEKLYDIESSCPGMGANPAGTARPLGYGPPTFFKDRSKTLQILNITLTCL